MRIVLALFVVSVTVALVFGWVMLVIADRADRDRHRQIVQNAIDWDRTRHDRTES